VKVVEIAMDGHDADAELVGQFVDPCPAAGLDEVRDLGAPVCMAARP
jgi:hypothetical protein